MPDKEIHIIEWILKKTEDKQQRDKINARKRARRFENKKWSVDNNIFFCESCKTCWSNVTKYIDGSKWKKYPKGFIPSIGKKRKECPHCE